MHRLTVNLTPGQACDSANGRCIDVPDISIALVVAEINMERGTAEIRHGETLLATIEKIGPNQAPYWRVGP